MVQSRVNNKSLRSSGPQTFYSSILSISLPGVGVGREGRRRDSAKGEDSWIWGEGLRGHEKKKGSTQVGRAGFQALVESLTSG